MEKKRVFLPQGTFIDHDSVVVGRAVIVFPGGQVTVTSQVVRYFLSSRYCMIETKNTVYQTAPVVC